MQTLALLYMGAGIVNTITGMVKELDQNIEVVNLVNDGILPAAGRNGNELPTSAFEQLMHSLMTAELAGADAMMVTCSSISEFVDYAKPFARIPVFKIDEPMFLEALSRGSRIGVAATIATTLKPSLRQVQRLADEKGQKIELDHALVESAYQAFLKGDVDLHNQLIQSAVKELCDRNDVVCLAQASMLSVVRTLPEEYQAKILSSPALGVERVVKYLQSVRWTQIIHTHDDRPEVMFFTAGRGIVHCNGEDIPVEPEVLCYIEPGDLHYVYNNGPETLKFFVVFVPPITAEQNYSRALKMQAKEKAENVDIR